MLLTDLKSIDADYVEQLCQDSWPESNSLEFKRELPASTDEGRIELCKDVCAFANADGGDLIFGIAEASGCASKVFPLTVNNDAEIRRLTQTLDALVEPRIGGLQFQSVSVPGGAVLVVRIPSSYSGPHSIRIKTANSRRFVTRSAAAVSEMSHEQIRTAFDRTSTLAERANAFIEKRVRALSTIGPPLTVLPGPMLVVHGVPLAAIAGKLSVSVRELHAKFTQYRSSYWNSIDRHFNVEGLCVTGEYGNDTRVGYVQIYRNGITERVESAQSYANQRGTPCISAPHISAVLHDGLLRAFRDSQEWRATGPMVLGVSLLNVGGFAFEVPDIHRLGKTVSNQAHLILPPAWVESVQDAASPEIFIRPLMDIVWQAFDSARCTYYDEAGNWIEP